MLPDGQRLAFIDVPGHEALRTHHDRWSLRHRCSIAHHRRRRRGHAADPGARRHPQAARRHARCGRAHQVDLVDGAARAQSTMCRVSSKVPFWKTHQFCRVQRLPGRGFGTAANTGQNGSGAGRALKRRAVPAPDRSGFHPAGIRHGDYEQSCRPGLDRRHRRGAPVGAFKGPGARAAGSWGDVQSSMAGHAAINLQGVDGTSWTGASSWRLRTVALGLDPGRELSPPVEPRKPLLTGLGSDISVEPRRSTG